MKEDKQKQIIHLINQIIEASLFQDLIDNGKKLDGETWQVHHLRLLRELIEGYFNEK
jgi:hypothetical protein